MINKIDVGRKISAIRNDLNYTQQNFAEMLDVSPQAVSKWESGYCLPSLEVLLKISWISKLSINTILEGIDYNYDIQGIDRGLLNMSELLICPECKEKLALNYQKKNQMFYSCNNNHRYDVIDGVIFFNTREIKGELWSLYLKNYEQYVGMHEVANVNPNFMRGRARDKIFSSKIMRIKPRFIIDVASGAGSGVEFYISQINWPCTIIMTDLSHRILKYNRQFFEEKYPNPYVDMVYIACDCSRIPLPEKCVDAVTSFAGFESMQDKFMHGVREGYRVLKPKGSAIYTKSLVEGDDNTKRWVDLLLKDKVIDASRIENYRITKERWNEICENIGFNETESVEIYGELISPDTEHFPFGNEIMQWMAEYIMVSHK